MISRGVLRGHGIPLLQLHAPSIILQEKSGPWPKDCRPGSKRKLVMLTISWGWQGKSFITPRNSPGYLWFITQWDMVAVLHSQLKKHSLALSSLQRTIACCHSRIGWLGDGDANTSLFHLHARHRKHKNVIGHSTWDHQVFTDHDDNWQGSSDSSLVQWGSELIGTNIYS